ncbi:hypothetical protein QQS21_003888 [Conoideocrella luteorostrata]|uniref:Uncharacterized protein n=1 Tax=Conoideocrella luteorostrata TaxID=1105319 RepID=A0AAJ0CSM5_9HYPO|nr:hypothetical protein QQS21_003888 [Conoideocrella luteorostrata]
MMLPPVDEQVIRENPEFSKLYKTLQNDVLNPDGSTKCDSSLRERTGVQKYLLERAITTTSLPDPKKPTSRPEDTKSRTEEPAQSPTSFADLLLVLPSLIDSDQPTEPEVAAEILRYSLFSEFDSHLPELGDLVSANLHASALSVARIAHLSTDSSTLPRHIPSLPADHAALRDRLSEARLMLMKGRLKALVASINLLQSYTQSLALLVQSLESKHGLASRNLELRALDVSQDAQQTEIDANAALDNVSKDIYSPKAISALKNYASHLKDAQGRTAERVRGLQAELAEYSVGKHEDGRKEKTMREMARVYREIESQMEDVKKDLDRLDDRRS